MQYSANVMFIVHLQLFVCVCVKVYMWIFNWKENAFLTKIYFLGKLQVNAP